MNATDFDQLATDFRERIERERTGVRRKPDPERPQRWILDRCPYCRQPTMPCECDAPYPEGAA